MVHLDFLTHQKYIFIQNITSPTNQFQGKYIIFELFQRLCLKTSFWAHKRLYFFFFFLDNFCLLSGAKWIPVVKQPEVTFQIFTTSHFHHALMRRSFACLFFSFCLFTTSKKLPDVLWDNFQQIFNVFISIFNMDFPRIIPKEKNC